MNSTAPAARPVSVSETALAMTALYAELARTRGALAKARAELDAIHAAAAAELDAMDRWMDAQHAAELDAAA